MAKPKKLDPAIKKRVDVGIKHFEETMGHLPVQMQTLSSNMPEVFAGYMDIRQWVMREPPEGAMPRKYKHLIFTLLDCVYGTTGFKVLDNVLASAEGKAALKKKKQRGG